MNKETILRYVLERLHKITDRNYMPDQDLMEEGGLSSLELMELIVNVEQEFQVKIPTRMLRFVETAEDLVKLVCEKKGIK
ncbi:MAG: acyl carrier protein [Clostridium sp.]|nr:acyl carrier protein [Clostridium sp.]